MRNLLLLRKIGCGTILIIICYHVIFGIARSLIDVTYPNGLCNNNLTAFGEELRVSVFSNVENPNIWILDDIQPEKQKHPEHGFLGTSLDNNVYNYEVEMGWFYQYKTMYVYGRNGFWIIQNDPFHIKLLHNENISAEDAQHLDETIAGYNIYGDQFVVVNNESDLTKEEKQAYVRVKEKAQPRIKLLQEQGLFP